jgi:phosphonopyruvate decarboxylase
MGLAGGFGLAGKIPVVMMQNDGYGNAVNPLSSLQLLYKLPCLLIITWRGEPGRTDAPQHQIMGETLFDLLSTFDIPFRVLEPDGEKLSLDVGQAVEHIHEHSLPFALIIKKGFFEKHDLKSATVAPDLGTRVEFLRVLSERMKPDSVVIGATGFTGRELMQEFPHSGKLYMVGSMGCAGAIGLGIALENPDRTVYVLDGDGALLMKLGTLSTIGYHRPKNLVHICFDNGRYESTGGQSSASSVVDFAGIASNCGYSSSCKVSSASDFERVTDELPGAGGPHFLHVVIRSGTIEGLKRPSETPLDMRNNMMRFLGVIRP